MKRKGISLIVLVITIVVIIILAAAVILSLGKNNPINSAKEARVASDIDSFQSELTVNLAKRLTDSIGNFDVGSVNATGDEIKEYIPSIEGKKVNGILYSDILAIENGKLVLKADITKDDLNESIVNALERTLNVSVPDYKAAGFYDADGNLVTTYKDSCVDVTINYTTSNYKTSTTSMYYYLQNNTNVVEVVLPESITSIGNYAFFGCRGLISVTIPNSVTSIGDYAFGSCSSLTSVTIPSSVTSIVLGTFSYCTGLTNVTIPSSVTSIGIFAFTNCSGLTDVTIPSSVTSIGREAFSKCSGLTDLIIPSSVISIGDRAFVDCSVLESIIVDSNNTVYDSRDNCNAIIQKSNNSLIVGCKNTVIPSSVTSIGMQAFLGCTGLKSVTIPKDVTSIGTQAFYRCSGLESIIIDSNNTVYDSKDNCNAIIQKSNNSLIVGCKNTVIPSSVTSIKSGAFSFCSSLTSITIPSSVTSIEVDAFRECAGLISITVDSNNTVYDSRDNCNAIIQKSNNSLILGCKNTIIPSSVTSIGSRAFSGHTGLTSVTIPNSVTSIGVSAFDGCSGLTNVIIPSSVTSIGGFAFANCSGLTSVTIPSSVTSIGSYAFSQVGHIYYDGTATGSPWGAKAIN